MIKLVKDNRAFLFPYLVFLLITLPFIIIYSKAEIHLYLNQFNTPVLDFLAKYITYLGDGLVITVIGVIVLLWNIRAGLLILLSYYVSGFFSQFFKKLFFSDVQRPSKFFQDMVDLYVVEGVKLHSYESFPSGHATTGFAVFFILAMFFRQTYLKVICFLFALLVAYSRVYLSQHFLMDIFAGSVLGTIVAYFLYYLINPSIQKQTWSEKTLQAAIKSNKK